MEQKERYTEPIMVKHDSLQSLTGGKGSKSGEKLREKERGWEKTDLREKAGGDEKYFEWS